MFLEPKNNLQLLVESGKITSAEANLRSKISSLQKSITNLQAKKERIDYEIRKQKQSLTRKRQELKFSSKSVRNREKALSESTELSFFDSQGDINEFLRDDQILLQESHLLLDE